MKAEHEALQDLKIHSFARAVVFESDADSLRNTVGSVSQYGTPKCRGLTKCSTSGFNFYHSLFCHDIQVLSQVNPAAQIPASGRWDLKRSAPNCNQLRSLLYHILIQGILQHIQTATRLTQNNGLRCNATESMINLLTTNVFPKSCRFNHFSQSFFNLVLEAKNTKSGDIEAVHHGPFTGTDLG